MATTVFGEVAAQYDDVRPGYPAEMADALAGYIGGTPEVVAEIGAGTGKGTELFSRLGAPMLCVEPDPRMAEHLRAKFPRAEVVSADFDGWTPARPLPVLAGTLIWHLLDPATRCVRAHAVLAEGGVLALIGRKHSFADDEQRVALDAAFATEHYPVVDRGPEWIVADLRDSGLFDDVRVVRFDSDLALPTEAYLRMVQTFSPFRLRQPDAQERLLGAIRDAVEATGGVVRMRLETTLNLGRRLSLD
ncbi:methyltransferase domain-containing protein [Hamadaea sp. NPDC051192]|uniref:class I SAM-dependent methyltransferase n=1 Tax=Hamadaea sp. NPDC051192 TaxID=3154940 RepID=UPI0034355363